MKNLLEKYIGQEIGINYKEVAKFNAATLVSVNDYYFTIEVLDSRKAKISIHYPYNQVMFASECENGFYTGGFFSSKEVKILVQIYALIVGGNGNSVGVGIGVVF